MKYVGGQIYREIAIEDTSDIVGSATYTQVFMAVWVIRICVRAYVVEDL
jgi:hypothetical protein